jgi:hypothetical protein
MSLSGGQLIPVASTVIHPTYGNGANSFDYDFAFYIGSTPIVVQAPATALIPLPAQNATIADDANCFIAGWGSERV